MKTRLVKQFNRGKRISREKVNPIDRVEIDLDRKGTALAIADNSESIIGKLERAKVDTISFDGLCISGLEEHYTNGIQGYYYQEWWCITRPVSAVAD